MSLTSWGVWAFLRRRSATSKQCKFTHTFRSKKRPQLLSTEQDLRSVGEQTLRETTTHVYNSQMHDMNRSRTSGEGSAEKRKPRKRKAEASGSDNIFPGTYT